MARKFRKKVLLAKIEVTYGTDSVPVGATDAILTKDLEVTEFEGSTEQRNLDRETLGNDTEYHVGIYSMLKFKVELAGAGSVGGIPAYGVLLRCCGYAETNNVGVDTQYDPVSSGEESASLYFNIDGKLHKLLGCRGKVDYQFSPGAMPYYDFEIWGLRVAPTDTALPTGDFSNFQVPVPVNDANTPTFTLHGYAAKLIAGNIGGGGKLVYRNVVNGETIELVDREPAGQCTIEDPTVAQKDFSNIAENHTLAALQLVHGTTAGNIVTLDCPKVQILKPRYTDSDSIVALQMDLRIIPNAGDDDIKITVT